MLNDNVEQLRQESWFVTPERFDNVLERLQSVDQLVIDTETDGLQPWHGNRLCGIGFALSENEAYYLPYRHPDNNLPLETLDSVWDTLNGVSCLIGHNIKFDMAMIRQDGYESPMGQKLFDVIAAARLCNTEHFANLSLSGQLEKFIGIEAREYNDEFDEYLVKNKWKKSYNKAPAEIVGNYCVGDVTSELRLLGIYEEMLYESEQFHLWEQEKAVTYALWKMEEVGFAIDAEYGREKLAQLAARILNLEQEIYIEAGKEFNFNSNPQLTQVMKSLKIKSPIKSPKTGEPSWNAEVMESLNHPLAQKILEIRGLQKLKDTYFEAILAWPFHTVHCQHRSWGTITGRMSCADPNLQNVAKTVVQLAGEKFDVLDADKDNAVSVRRIFINRPKYRLYMLDYSQMEMRVFAEYLGDEGLLEALNNSDFDFHDHTTTVIWGIEKNPGEARWEYYRSLAKSINFGLIYGMGVKLLAKKMKTSVAKAKEYKEQYFDSFPLADKFIKNVAKRLNQRGYIQNMFGRRYYLDADKAYIGVNYLVQGTCADIVKNRLVACQQYLEEVGAKSRILIQVHDELIFEVHEDEEDWLPWKMQEILQEPQIKAFLKVEVSRGNPSWAQKETWDIGIGQWTVKD